MPSGMKTLHELRDKEENGLMRADRWRNDATAVESLITIGETREQWISTILSDPVAGKDQLATQHVDCADW